MNRTKLARRTALAAKIRDRHNPPYRIVCAFSGITLAKATTRDEARAAKRRHVSADVLRRMPDGTYAKVR